MKGFIFYNPTQIVFGEDQTKKIGKYIKVKKCLLLYGGGSIKKNGIYDKVVESLNKYNVSFVEKSGIKPNPVLSFVYEAIEFAKKEQVEAILAVGGGSVIDSAKAIAAGFYYDGDVWDFFIDKAQIKQALPIYTVLTLAATASEMNSGAVITNEKTKQKFNIRSDCLFPKVSILDPINTYTVPKDQVANGSVDAIVHLLEGYFTKKYPNTPIQDGFVETLVKTIISSTKEILKEPANYDARANFMWSATLALNGLTTAGIGEYAFPNHMIGHSLSALFDIAHGQSLSIVFPAWLKYNKDTLNNRLEHFGKEVFGVKSPDKAIEELEIYFKAIGAPTKLKDVNLSEADIEAIAQNAISLAKKWGLNDYSTEKIASILKFAL
ncbi:MULTISPECIES: iron-containing alcohol dehydrogenase [Desulfurella]|uniref:iron-containing alcohol dehydrogenase n=1 Tax=Desulfurella TaxID=33001 RepID=UPI000CBC0EDB|nr:MULTISPECIES: iron-containing alcohol dehydrogenase [Desulfurella]PMP64926.1 MAG: NADH-dependent alcohol dehydrogenase [Desulfurella multipotens]PMP93458.1 MAG: NADH-dependent alcohol dehydrogenase [Desulfurella sp.]